jgi:hypothetical protein
VRIVAGEVMKVDDGDDDEVRIYAKYAMIPRTSEAHMTVPFTFYCKYCTYSNDEEYIIPTIASRAS